MRIRSIKPEFWTSESIGRLDRDARLIFVGLWSLADDEGRFRADPRYIAGQLLPYDSDSLAIIRRSLASLLAEGCLLLYEADRSQYGLITGWSRHQKIDRPTKSRIPQPPEISLANSREHSSRPREDSCEDQGTGNREQGAGKGAGIGAASPASAVAAPAERATEVRVTHPSPTREASAALLEDFEDVTGERYAWQGAKDGDALAWLLKQAPLEDVRKRWKRGLKATGWLNVATVAQLRSKWNDLAKDPATNGAHLKHPGKPGVFTESKDLTDEF